MSFNTFDYWPERTRTLRSGNDSVAETSESNARMPGSRYDDAFSGSSTIHNVEMNLLNARYVCLAPERHPEATR